MDEPLKTWRDIEEAALNCPFLNAAVTRVQCGDLTREQALIYVALGLSRKLQNFIEAETTRLMNETRSHFAPHTATPAKFG